jgi:hypothetical protein
MQPNRKTEQATAPAAAFQFRAEAAFAAAGGEQAKTRKVDILARTGGEADHWYWGRVVHDMAGMMPARERIPLDFNHDPSTVIGYGNNITNDGTQLRVSGTLTPFKPDDVASEIIYKAEQGVPYQASILTGWSDMTVEEVPDGMSVTVNGGQFAGPGFVIRKWSLQGLALCPYGSDSATAAQFHRNTQPVSFRKDTLMTDSVSPVVTEAAPTTPAVEVTPDTSTPEATPTANAATAVEGMPAQFTGADYIAAFGDVGARWFIEGKSFAACATEHAASLKASYESQIAQLKTERDEFKARLDATPLGTQPIPAKVQPGSELTGFARFRAASISERQQPRRD